MTRWNHSIDNPSPLIAYTPSSHWYIPTNITDPTYWSSYSNDSTATATDYVGAMLMFEFMGTGIWVYGAKRATHGYYNVSLDNTQNYTLNGQDQSNSFGQLLFSAQNLNLSSHTLSITNAGPLSSDPSAINYTSFDIDWITWETDYDGPGGSIDAQVTELLFDNDHPRFEYLPASAWDQGDHSIGYANGTSETTSSASAQLKFTFDGDAIALYGTVNPSHGDFVASIDGTRSKTLSGTWNVSAYQQILYYAENLGAGTHNLIVQNQPTDDRNHFSVDYVKTWTARGGSGGPDTPKTDTSNPAPAGPIAGGVVGGLLFLALCVAGFFLYRRRQRQKLAISRIPVTRPISSSPSTFTINTTHTAQSSNLRSPFGEEYAVPFHRNKQEEDDDASRTSHASQPSMGSISSTITDNSMQFLVAAHRQSATGGGVGMGLRDDEIIPMSRIPSNSGGPSSTKRQSSTYTYPSTGLHPFTAGSGSGVGGKNKRYSGESKEPEGLEVGAAGNQTSSNLLRRMTPLERQDTSDSSR